MEHDSHHIIPFKTYLNILLGLLFLTVLTVLVAKPVSGFDAGVLNAFIAMLIASVKAGLVAAYFMHLKYDNKLHLALFLISIFFLVVLFAFSWFDIITRIQQLSTL
ncbi:MAG: cytochrome C oxidase subunit IV family protein [Bdellovibrionales bacterium]|nr:cytochrome C oxidase subunit IV family protein [Bdellovibrionales bacterium]